MLLPALMPRTCTAALLRRVAPALRATRSVVSAAVVALGAVALPAQDPARPAPAAATTASASTVARSDTLPPGARQVDATTEDATREELTRLLARAEQQANDPARPAAERTRARAEATAITQRLETGDLRTGDRFLLTLTLDSLVRTEVALRDGPVLEFGALAPLPLHGVLRSELTAVVEQHLRRFYRTPQVRVEPLVRLAVVGGVARPGPISVLSDMQLLDMLSAAGGLSQNSESDKIVVRRGNKEVVNGKRFQQAVREGKTVAQVGLRSGDQVEVGTRSGRFSWSSLRFVFWGLSAVIAVLGLIRASYQY